MAEGTRRTVDERLTNQEERLEEFQETVQRIEDMMMEMRNLLVDKGKGSEAEQARGVNNNFQQPGVETAVGAQIGFGSLSSPLTPSLGFGSISQQVRPLPIYNFSQHMPQFPQSMSQFTQSIPNFSQPGPSFTHQTPPHSQPVPAHSNLGDSTCYIPQFHNPPLTNPFVPRYQYQPYMPIVHNLPYANHKKPKIFFPKFDGTDPKGWLYKCDEYFDFNPMEELRKVRFAAIHMEGRALRWFRSYKVDKGPILWGMFGEEVCKRFSPVEQDDPQDDFNKQRQTGTVDEYYDRFEELRSLIAEKHKGFTEEYYISGFLSGLKEDIKGVVKLLKPSTLADAIYLARQEESRNKKGGHVFKPVYNANGGRLSVSKPVVTKAVVQSATSISPGSNFSRPKLTAAEINERRRKGLCFYCDELYL